MNKGELDDAVRRALNIFDTWNDVTCAVVKGSGSYYELQGVVEDAVHCGAQAATQDFRPLESEADDFYDGNPDDLDSYEAQRRGC